MTIIIITPPKKKPQVVSAQADVDQHDQAVSALNASKRKALFDAARQMIDDAEMHGMRVKLVDCMADE